MLFARLDARSLSLARICIGFILLLDGIYRIQYAEPFFSDEGIWPSHLIKNFGWQPGYWSVHLWIGGKVWLYVCLFLQIFLSVLFIAGIGRKITQFFLWAILVSAHNRNLYILQSGDDLIRNFLFLSLFTDMFEYFTINNQKRIYHYERISSGNILIIFQIFTVYLFTVYFKLQGNDWLPDGQAVYYALSIDQIRYPVGNLIYEYPGLMRVLSYTIYIMECLIALFIIMPYKTSFFRTWAFLMLIFIHTGFAISMKIGFFPFISMATASIFIPTSWWEFLSKKFDFFKKNYVSGKYPFYDLFLEGIIIKAFLLFLILTLNLTSVKSFPFEPDRPLAYVINVLRLNQYWGMFSPNIPRADGWHEAWGRREDGSVYVLESPVKGSPGQKPDDLYVYFPTDRWRKLTENMSRDEYTFLRPLYCKYLINKYKKQMEKEKLAGIELVFFREINLPGYRINGPEKELWCYCLK
ncbi:MAG: HTTM domain-containing protein [Bacteroidia bacterium]|nr:HTTM domain-containing protein [Bacteroidia bacterium]